MIKKIVTIVIILIVSLIAIYFTIFLIQNFTLEKSLVQNYNEGEKVSGDELAFTRCNYNVLDPEFATTFFIKEEGNIGFYRPNKIFWGSEQDWDNSYTGGTTIKNTTFPELVEMVKDDCYQFQEGHGDYYGEDLAWSYSPYEPEPEMTEQDIIDLEIRDMMRELYMQKKD